MNSTEGKSDAFESSKERNHRRTDLFHRITKAYTMIYVLYILVRLKKFSRTRLTLKHNRKSYRVVNTHKERFQNVFSHRLGSV